MQAACVAALNGHGWAAVNGGKQFNNVSHRRASRERPHRSAMTAARAGLTCALRAMVRTFWVERSSWLHCQSKRSGEQERALRRERRMLKGFGISFILVPVRNPL